MAHIFLVRHGQASFGADDYDRLSPLGYQQAQVTAQYLAPINGDRWVSGSLLRHKQTAAAMSGIDIVEDAGWNEFDYLDVIRAVRPDLCTHKELVTEFQGRPKKAFQALYTEAVARWASGAYDGDYRETRNAFRERVDAALHRASERSKRVIVITSGGPISAVVQRTLDLDEAATRRVEAVLANASVTALSTHQDSLRLISFNSHLHLGLEHELITFR